MGASPSPVGAARGLWQTRIPLEGCVFPDMFALALAHQAFDEHGQLQDPKLAERLKKDVSSFVRLAEATSSICGERATGKGRRCREKIVTALEE